VHFRSLLGRKLGKGKVLLVNAVLFLMTVQAFQPHPQPYFQCPFDWIWYRGKCYYFSEVEGNWTSSQDNCSALGKVETFPSPLFQSFVMRYKGISEHWVGLLREDEEQPWQWVNRYVLCTSRFQIRGGGLCAYLDDNGLSSSHCSTERSWICNKHEQPLGIHMR
uniref:C-type lectin domain-containing protein n=1 Tax=Cyanoderma ruficeps TaxID=181631 RepID=A0A8C3RHB9_9PASS